VLSPRDWARIAHWHASGIPLALLDETLAAAVARATARAGPLRIADLARAVEESWSVIVEGRLAAEGAPVVGVPRDPLQRWRERRDQEPDESPLARLLDDLLRRVADGEAPAALDADLDRRLEQAVPSELRVAEGAAVEQDLEPFRGRMRSTEFAATRARALLRRLRRRLDLPQLARRPPPA